MTRAGQTPGHPRAPWLLVAAGLASLLGLAGPTRAADPTLRWWTITTPHFHVHYHEGGQPLAQRVARTAEQALGRVAELLGQEPSGRIELVLTDETDSANGFAGVLPYDHVVIYASAPRDMSELHDFDDHLQLVILHELTHIVHMNTISGIPAWINRVLGRTVFPNGAQPGWFSEGLAVQAESALSSAGRIRSSMFQMYLRTAALAGRFPDLDEMGGAPRAWPQGTSWYLYGGFFLDYLAKRFGQQALAGLIEQMGGMIVPWTLNIIARRVVDQDYLQLHADWRAQVGLAAQARLARIEAEGLTAWRPLTTRAQLQLSPRVSPGGGQVLYFSGPTDAWPSLRLVGTDGSNDRPLAEVNTEGGAAFGPDGRTVVFAQVEVVDQFYYYDDLHRIDLETGQVQRLTDGLRAREPDVSPDGRWVVFVRNRMGATCLGLLDLSDRSVTDLTALDDRRQVYTPRFSPDGRSVVYSQGRPDGGREIVLLELPPPGQRARQPRRLTRGRTMDLQPAFGPDGKRVYFSSDRTGIYNLHAVELATGKVTRVTNVATGAFSPDPAPDGRGLAFVIYGPDGYDVAWLELPQAERPAVTTRTDRPPPPYEVDDQVYPEERYSPWWSLLPRAWFPTWGEDPWGTTLGLLVNGQDAVGKLSWSLDLQVGTASGEVQADAGLTARVIYPSLSLYYGRHVGRRNDLAAVNGWSVPVDREEHTLFADVSFPFAAYRQYHAVYLNYDLHLYDRWTRIPRDPLDMEPVLPDDRPLAWVGLGWYGASSERYLDSISTEKGLAASVSLRYSHPSIGSGSEMVEARLWLRGYVPVVPRLRHVLAFGLQAGLAVGDERRRSLFWVGGLPIRDPLRDSYFGYRYSGVFLRGYEPYAFAGAAYLLASAEYRLPLVDVHRGIWTLPFYVRDLHAAVFVDAGGASPEPRLDRIVDDLLKVGVGAELRLDMLLAYHLPFSIRFGYGRGLMAGGINNVYLTLGSGF